MITGCEKFAKWKLEAGREMLGCVVGVLWWKGKAKLDPMNKFTEANGEAEVKQL